MNKNFFFGMALLLCSACASRTEEFVVRGSFPGLRDGMAVALRNMEGEGTFAVDTVRDGKFELRGAVVSPRYCNLLIIRASRMLLPEWGEWSILICFLIILN